MEFQRVYQSINLPNEWDTLADTYFQQTKFLLHTETYNPCQQRYYTCCEDGKLLAAAILYSLGLDLLTFVNIKSPVKMNIVGIPCSVSCQGIFGTKTATEALKAYICRVEKGFVLFLNLEDEPGKTTLALGKTLPTIVLKNNFRQWDDYLASLRSNYRRRFNRINQHNKQLRFEKKACSEFTHEMYQQYLEVYRRSSGKLEKLNFGFFKNLPLEFMLTVCWANETIIGWNIALENQHIYYFFLGGIDYKLNKIHNTYLGLLYIIVKDGIEKKAEVIELGQTAEIPKMRMGGKPETRYMQAYHTNRFLNRCIKSLGFFLEYKRKLENTHVMKEERK